MSLTVIDPLSRKIDVPRVSITDTRAVHREGCPSLCLLFMEGRCRQGTECNQIHADPVVVRQLRQVANTLPTCCQFHGDSHKSLFEKFPEWVGTALAVDGVVVPLEFAAFTQGLQRSMDQIDHSKVNQSVVITPTFVCRLQAGGHCRYSEECKFVHLCREVTAQHLSHCVFPLATDLERKHKNNLQAAHTVLTRPTGATNGNQKQNTTPQPQNSQSSNKFGHQNNKQQPQPQQHLSNTQFNQNFQQPPQILVAQPPQFQQQPQQHNGTQAPPQPQYVIASAMPGQQQQQQVPFFGQPPALMGSPNKHQQSPATSALAPPQQLAPPPPQFLLALPQYGNTISSPPAQFVLSKSGVVSSQGLSGTGSPSGASSPLLTHQKAPPMTLQPAEQNSVPQQPQQPQPQHQQQGNPQPQQPQQPQQWNLAAPAFNANGQQIVVIQAPQ